MAKLLLVEDNVQLAQDIKDWLEFEHFSVDVAHDGTLGLQLFEKNQYDLYILDWELPSMSGLDICKQIRIKAPEARVIFLTGRTDMRDKLQGFDAGADDYIVKPFQGKELSARVRSLLRRVEVE